MYSKIAKKGMLFAALTGALVFGQGTAYAAEQGQTEKAPDAGVAFIIEKLTNDQSKVQDSLIPAEQEEYSNIVFSNVNEGSFLYIRSEASKDSEWVGKLYPDEAARIAGPVDEWTFVQSGSVQGYVKTEYLLTGEAAEQKAAEQIRTVRDQGTIVNGEKDILDTGIFETAVSKEEEIAVEAAAAEVQAVEAAANISAGQAVVDYAMQFIGNPYVWGGTSLTNGADCSGFIQSVYAQFGVSMPRTSGEMRSAGYEVSYEEALPGDVICYNGHVGIYMGDGQIVNAIDDAHGIGISNAAFTNIITVRRLI